MKTTCANPNTRVAEIKLSYRTHVKASERPKVDSSKAAHELLRATWDIDTIEFVEHFKVLLLNRGNRALGILTVSTGGVSGTVADPKVIFAAAIKSNASGIILAHNHPSGNLAASAADLDLTRKLKEAGKLLEIQVLDHIVITADSFFSMTDEGIL
jgi:DNA repair protein RadC